VALGRRAQLRGVRPPLVDTADGFLFSEALAAEGAVVFAKACELGLEGIVSKRAGSFYQSGKSGKLAEGQEPEFRQDVDRGPSLVPQKPDSRQLSSEGGEGRRALSAQLVSPRTGELCDGDQIRHVRYENIGKREPQIEGAASMSLLKRIKANSLPFFKLFVLPMGLVAFIPMAIGSARAHDKGCDGNPVPRRIKSDWCGEGEEHQLKPEQISRGRNDE
jgi:hypothetical protein